MDEKKGRVLCTRPNKYGDTPMESGWKDGGPAQGQRFHRSLKQFGCQYFLAPHFGDLFTQCGVTFFPLSGGYPSASMFRIWFF
jgi:hypothetical protein